MCITRQRESARLKPEDIGGIEAWPALRCAKMMITSCISLAAATPSLGWSAQFLPGLSLHVRPVGGPGAFLAVAVLNQAQSEDAGTQCVLLDGF